MWVAGIATAPILCNATMVNQNSYLFFKVSITLSPFLMPFLVKKFAILLLYFLTSEKVKVCFSSSSFVQIKAIFSGSISAYLSITSNPKLKLSGYVILKFL